MSFDDGLKSGNYSKNPYSEDSAEFDSFERGCTQALKRGILNIDRLRADVDYYSSNRPAFIDMSELKGSKVIDGNNLEPLSNSYARAKGY
ncbi:MULTISPECIES: hypothetical protein [unclassified Pseudoalteromonas]|jgi:hypothetical protein|uniref:hypothetical protein n=1 Tax=unclassified Pseudoalteromonas TaxID=194690 RepID=UPI001601408D|nr:MULTISPECIES: hypothetical protein [unclassified Pseudoalteromonas]MBB1295461.1 hypothetical protein [Pseudoalteromonas sp. SR41-4]MBB1410247.1 hypothetical protein [Pseudoalteromonas sp. SG44-17]MBB1470634.1 hypothetical protein [Pseudoalteromonas sp. SG41-5]|tara:strand:- start:6631 stop:6900 length:270 start_codon:yes stop_codon:yes gene_type:complete